MSSGRRGRKRDIKSVFEDDTNTNTNTQTKRRKLNCESLSDNETKDDIQHNNSTLSSIQMNNINQNGYCHATTPLKNKQIIFLVEGYIRNNFNKYGMTNDLMGTITNFYDCTFDSNTYIKLISGKINAKYFLIPKNSIKLSKLLSNMMDTNTEIIDIYDKVKVDILDYIIKYLGYHKGIKPGAIVTPISSINMSDIVSDEWDAQFMDSCNKKTVFEIIMSANYLDIQCLLQLGCSKIATLIKGLSPNEISNLLAAGS